jgi:hypothetical protein
MGANRTREDRWAVFQCGTIRSSWLEVKTADGKTTICKLKNNQLDIANRIAAEPDMYAALKELTKVSMRHEVEIDDEWGDGRDLVGMEKAGAFSAEVYSARAALAKAEGRNA